MSDREERLALNEAVFRSANERMAGWEERHEDDEPELYMCECADPECRVKISMQRADYEEVRRDATHFFVAPGHEIPDIETVIDTRDDWVVIEKNPEVREIVEKADARTPDADA